MSFLSILSQGSVQIHWSRSSHNWGVPLWEEKWKIAKIKLGVTPCTVACQAPPFMGFLRQGYWSGLPFPSPRIWFFCNPMGCGLPGSSVLGKSLGVGCHFLLQGIFPTQGSNPGLLCWQADSATEPHTVTNLVRYRALALQFAHLTPLLVRTCMSRVSGTSKVTPGAMICYGDSQNSPSTCTSFVWCLTHFSIKATLSFALLYEIGIICFVMWVNRINKFEGFLFYSFSF